MLQPVAGAWAGLAGARGWVIFNTFVFLWRAPAIFSGRGKTTSGFSCVPLCWTISSAFIKCKFDSLMVSYS